MATRVLLARVGAGKTDAVQRELHALKQSDPLARVWVLLSTERQISDFRRRFMAGQPVQQSVSFNVETFNFYSLYRRLLALAGNPQRCLDAAARYGLIRALLADLYRDGDGIFAGIAQAPGFINIIATFLFELKQNLIFPDVFEAAAMTPKERELAEIYTRYQQTLREHDLVDREGEGWLAVEALDARLDLAADVDLLVVDGYDQFNYLQARLLALLGARVRDSLITLTTVPEREATIGRRFKQALDRLIDAHYTAEVDFTPCDFESHADARPLALLHLAEYLLLPRAPKTSADGAITLIEAPDPAREVGAILRRIKRLLLDGCAPDDVLIAVRDWGRYGGQIAAQGRRYGLPLALHYGDPLGQNPAVVALQSLIDLHVGDFRRRDLLDVLRSPYFAVTGIDEAEADLLERISVEFRVMGGRKAWLEAIALAAQGASSVNDQEDDAQALLIDRETAAQLWGALDAFFAAVTPPEQGMTADYVAWLEGVIGADLPDPDEIDPEDEAVGLDSGYSLNVPMCVRESADAEIVARDLSALQALKLVLRGLLSAQELAVSLAYARLLDSRTFIRDLNAAIDTSMVGRSDSREGRVLVTTVADARGLPHKHVFIPGLSEGIFPMPAPEDPLLLDSERLRLRDARVYLSTQAEQAGDDGLFYSLIGQARESLVLSRPHSKNGDVWAASHLWRAVQALFDDLAVEHLALGAVVANAATAQEAALAAADALSRGETPGWADAADWIRIRRGHAVEIGRISREPYDHYSGRLNDADLIAQIADEYGSHKVWSASQLNDLGVCGFRYYAKRLLALEALEDPADGMDAQQLGTLYHEILEETYARLGGVIAPERLNEALDMLDQVAAAKMHSAPDRLRFRASAQWSEAQVVLKRKLERLIRDDFSGTSPLDKKFSGEPREIYRQELKFGFGDQPPVTLDFAGEGMKMRGAIDRIDLQGDHAILIDYKTGSTPITDSEISDGRNFQMLVYLLAAQQLIEQRVEGSMFWHLGNGKGDVIAPDDDLIETGARHIRRYLELTRKGDFATHASKREEGKCTRYCEFHQLCRINVGGRGKA